MSKKTIIVKNSGRHDVATFAHDVIKAEDTGKAAGIALAGVGLCLAALSVINQIAQNKK